MAIKEPEIFTDKNQMRNWSRTMRSQGKTIGLVPTMGYLHHGHISLIKEAHKHTDLIVVSIYVNPGQFSPSEDLSTYPSDFHGDIQKLMAVPGGVNAVFHPHNLYDYGNVGMDNCSSRTSCGNGGDGEEGSEKGTSGVVSCVEQKGLGHETWVKVERLEKGMCGQSRPVFFRGVATVVTKLFNIVDPDVAVFGKKDYQQWRIIRRMAFGPSLLCGFRVHGLLRSPVLHGKTPTSDGIRSSDLSFETVLHSETQALTARLLTARFFSFTPVIDAQIQIV